MDKIKVGIVGFGNIGKGALLAANAAPDMEVRGVFSRRGLSTQDLRGIPAFSIEAAENMKSEIDVMILCGGTATDLPVQGPHFASMFNIVDSYDKHTEIPDYLAKVDAACNKTAAIISTGWDPGLFSMMRVLFESILPAGKSYTFWGKGVSQGHSFAVRQIEGVLDAVQYTIPIEDAVNAVRKGEMPELSANQRHIRECFVVAEPNADKDKIKEFIVNMPVYFADYYTIVNFIDSDTFYSEHAKMPHGGRVLHSGKTGDGGINSHNAEFSLELDCNPEFTSSVLVAYVRAAYRMAIEGIFGAKTVFDIPLSYISAKDRASLIREHL